MDIDFKRIIQSAAPMLGAALGGPFGGMAGKLVAEALGNPDAKPEDIPALLAQASPEQIAAIKKADQDFQVRMTALGFENEQKLIALATQDRQGARDMQTATRSRIPPTLALLIVLCWAMVQAFLFTNVIDPSMRELIARVLGTLDGALMLVLSFYFGSSHGSQQKTELLSAQK